MHFFFDHLFHLYYMYLFVFVIQLQESLLMFPGVLNPLLDKCGVHTDSSTSHPFFSQPDYR